MRDSEAAISAFYDYEQEQPSARRRSAPDWGADEVFATTPRRRFARREAQAHGARPHVAPARDRAGHGAGPAPADRVPAPADRAPAAAFADRAPAPADPTPARPHGAPAAGGQPLPAPSEHAVAAAALDLQLAEPSPVEPAPEPRRAPNGRRTVVVTGHPGLAAAPARRRPPRTVDERVGMRPDRVAGWAFGLGLVLIGVAAATASAAPV